MNTKTEAQVLGRWRKPIGIAFTILLGALPIGMGVLMWRDTQPYREALAAISTPAAMAQIEQDARHIELDGHVYGVCTKQIQAGADARTCWLDALAAVTSTSGIYAIGTEAALYLEERPEDDELREAALAAVARGWEGLSARRGHLARIQAVYDAEARSMVRRLTASSRDVGRWGRSTALSEADLLDRVEWRIRMPAVFRAMADRRASLGPSPAPDEGGPSGAEPGAISAPVAALVE